MMIGEILRYIESGFRLENLRNQSLRIWAGLLRKHWSSYLLFSAVFGSPLVCLGLSLSTPSSSNFSLVAETDGFTLLTSDTALIEGIDVDAIDMSGIVQINMDDQDIASLQEFASVRLDHPSLPVSLASITVPRDWYIMFSGEGGAMTRILGSPSSDKRSSPSLDAQLNIVASRGTQMLVRSLDGKNEVFSLSEDTIIELEFASLDLALLLVNEDRQIIAPISTSALALQTIGDLDVNAMDVSREPTIQSGSMWIESNPKSPFSLNHLDRIQIKNIDYGKSKVYFDQGKWGITARGEASIIDNYLDDSPMNLKPSLLDVVLDSKILNVWAAILVFFSGLEFTIRMKRRSR